MLTTSTLLRRNAARLASSGSKESDKPVTRSTTENELEDIVIHDPDVMQLDAQTYNDLEAFDSTVEGASLFELCNFTRSQSGSKALRRRMQRPWSNPKRIQSVQCSLAFLLENQEAFNQLPGYITTQIVDKYTHTSLPPLTGENPVDFALGALDMLYTDSRRYDVITQGVGVTLTLLSALQEVVDVPALKEIPDCELAEMIREIRRLLKHQRLVQLTTNREWGMGAWKTLRVDQVLRHHEKVAVNRLLELTYELDALLAMAIATRKLGFTMPEMDTGPMAVQAEGLIHPLVPNAIANPVTLNQQDRLLFLTGPNMAGKTTYLRAFAVALYFAHLGMGVPARSFRFVPAQKIFTSLSLADNLHAGISYFRAEGLRVKAIAKALNDGDKIIALMDEPFKGTNVKDAFDASRAILERLAAKAGSLFMFSSHLIELSEHFESIKNVDCKYFEAREDGGRLSFEYVLHTGVSSQRLGMRVLQEEGIFELLDEQK